MSSDHGPRLRALAEQITDYLGNGGFFNPELMDHDKVRDLLMDCRDALLRASASALPEKEQDVIVEVYELAKNHWSGQCFNFALAPEQMLRTAHECAQEGFDAIITKLSPIAEPLLAAEYKAAEADVVTSASALSPEPPEPCCEGGYSVLEFDKEDDGRIIATVRGVAYGSTHAIAAKHARHLVSSSAQPVAEVPALSPRQDEQTNEEDVTRGETRGDSIVSGPPQPPEGLSAAPEEIVDAKGVRWRREYLGETNIFRVTGETDRHGIGEDGQVFHEHITTHAPCPHEETEEKLRDQIALLQGLLKATEECNEAYKQAAYLFAAIAKYKSPDAVDTVPENRSNPAVAQDTEEQP